MNPIRLKAIICDIDGTLSHMTYRGPFDWTRVGEDTCDEVVKDILVKYASSSDIVRPRIILVSGRDGKCRSETQKWLRENEIPYDDLFMRPVDNNEKDTIIKERIYNEHIKDKFNVFFVLDDRNQVVDMWRSKGLKVLQVEPGDF